MKYLTLVLAALVLSACATTDHRHAVEYDVESLREDVQAVFVLAAQAQATAEEALEAARETQACCDANAERIDRLFEDTVQK